MKHARHFVEYPRGGGREAGKIKLKGLEMDRTDISVLKLSVRAERTLRSGGINTVSELEAVLEELERIPFMGQRPMAEIRARMAERGDRYGKEIV